MHSRCASPVTNLEPDCPIKSRCIRPGSEKSPTAASTEMEQVILLPTSLVLGSSLNRWSRAWFLKSSLLWPPGASKALRYEQDFSLKWASYPTGRVQLRSSPPRRWCACSSDHSLRLSWPHPVRTFRCFLNILLYNKDLRLS